MWRWRAPASLGGRVPPGRFNLLEDGRMVLLVDAQHVKAVTRRVPRAQDRSQGQRPRAGGSAGRPGTGTAAPEAAAAPPGVAGAPSARSIRCSTVAVAPGRWRSPATAAST